MEPATDGKSLENRLKKTTLAWAYTLTPPTGYEGPEPPHNDDDESLEEKVRRIRHEGSIYKLDVSEDETGQTDYE